MKEVIIKDNTTGLRIFINGLPDPKLIPKEEADIIIAALELQIYEFYKKKHNAVNIKQYANQEK